jgi:hypothetical protein
MRHGLPSQVRGRVDYLEAPSSRIIDLSLGRRFLTGSSARFRTRQVWPKTRLALGSRGEIVWFVLLESRP